MIRLATLTAALIALLAPAAASAQQCIAPPGTAAIDQYCETVPTATGDRGGTGASGGPGVTPRQLAELQSGGADAQGLARELNTRKPNTRKGSGADDSKAAPPVAARPAAETSMSPLSAVRSAVESGSTVGTLFGWALLGITLTATGAWWVGRTRREA